MGGQTCLTCRYEAREAIDAALVAGEPLRDIAGRTGLSKSSLDRHKRDHLSATLVKAAEATAYAKTVTLLLEVSEAQRQAIPKTCRRSLWPRTDPMQSPRITGLIAFESF
jgi:hypothetical protein